VRRLSLAEAKSPEQAPNSELPPEDARLLIAAHNGPPAQAGGLSSFVRNSCQKNKYSAARRRIAEDTHPPRTTPSAANQRRFRPRNRRQDLAALQGPRACPRSPACELVCGLKGRDANVPSGPPCRCLLCRVESELTADLISRTAVLDSLRSFIGNGLRVFASPALLLSHLRATQAGPSSDVLFRELLAARASEPQFVEMLMIVAFVPVLHGTVRRIAKQQLRLTRADITQQALSVFLQVLRSDQMEKRQSHFAFAISRAVKRQLFEWAGREGAVHGPGQTDEAFAEDPLTADKSMERHAVLRHFLHRCVSKGLLDNAELDLLIQIKLDGNTGEEVAESNSITSNAVRQRVKRLLAKLRRAAGNRMALK
jgi:DNA-directed RNA polymerase specialized sigma24 family protein